MSTVPSTRPTGDVADDVTAGAGIIDDREGPTRTPDGELEIAGRVDLTLAPDADDQRVLGCDLAEGPLFGALAAPVEIG